MTRVVLYAEGVGELVGETTLPGAPGDPIPDHALGAAHLLVRKALARARTTPEQAIEFIVPLRKLQGTEARGSDLHSPKVVRHLFTWPLRTRRPDLCVLLVDADGTTDRERTLDEVAARSAVTQPTIVGVAVQEFESWLLGDLSAVRRVFDVVPQPPEVESLPPRKAKTIFGDLCRDKESDPAKHKALRLDVARHANIVELEKTPSFRRFLSKLAAM